MAPVIQPRTTPNIGNGSERNESSIARRPIERRSDLICRVKYCNTLPDIPFDPKFITYPFDANRFVSYKPTSLEKSYKHDLLTEHDLGVDIDLINPETYAISTDNVPLHDDDEKLLEEEQAPSLLNLQRSRSHHKAVPWLKKTEYISTEFNRYGASSEKNETKVGYKMKKELKDDNLYLDRESQITAIDRTFEEAKKPITEHHNKRGVTPVEILPVFPDFDLWKYPFAQVQFDSEPAEQCKQEEMSQAMIRGVMDESGEQFVAYFLPTAETLQKRTRDAEEGVEYVEDEEYEYKMAREYNWNVKNKATKGYEENYFFVFRENALVYNELETRVRLTKRRAKAGQQPSNSKLVVKHRELIDSEYRTQDIRMKQLQPPQEDDETMEADELVGQQDEDGNEPGKQAQDNRLSDDEDDDELRPAFDDDETTKSASADKQRKRKSSSDESNDSDDSDEDDEDYANDADKSPKNEKSNKNNKKNHSSSGSSSSGSGSESSAFSSGSSSDSDDENDERTKRPTKNARDIFGSGSDSD